MNIDRSSLTQLSGAVHFMGIGGAGMRALAEALLHGGIEVTGCDMVGGTPPALARLGVTAHTGHSAEHAESIAALVITSAIPEDHPEIQAARARGIPVVKRAQALGAWVSGGKVVAVAGTHGKTSTTAMATHVLEAAGLEPTGFVGGTVRAWGSNLRVGNGEVFAVEADEYDRSFLALHPDVAIVTNVEADHLDIYGDEAGVDEAFRTFLSQVREGGSVVACADDSGASRILAGVVGSRVVTYGTSPGSMVRALDVKSRDGSMHFDIVDHGELQRGFTLAAPGLHNVRNALAAATAARAMGAGWDAIRKGLAEFAGVGRRFERLGDIDGIRIVDDYAHHPTEVEATISAAREAFVGRRLVVVFQPHLYTRTRDFHSEFGRALAGADLVWVTDVYPAREKAIPGIDGELVAGAVRSAGGECEYHPTLDGLADRVAEGLAPGDVCLTLGAGSIERVGPELVEVLQKRESVGSTANRTGT